MPERVARPSDTVQTSRPGDSHEREANKLARRALPASPPPATSPQSVDGARLSAEDQRWGASHFAHDFSRVRVHRGGGADRVAQTLDARACTVGYDIFFGRGEYSKSLLAHELAHVALDRGQRLRINRKTKGEQVVDSAHASFLDPDANVKADVDVMKAALKEVKLGKAVEFNRGAVKAKIDSALKALGKSGDLKAVTAEWDALVDTRAKAGTPGYVARERAFLKHFETPLAALSSKYPKAQTKYWLKNTPSQVLDEIFAAADADMPADQLYVYAMKEGLVDYVRDETGVGKGADPTTAQLAGVSTAKPISGFDYLGTDDFFTELTAKREPLTKFLPSGYDTKKVTPDPRLNEKKRTVQSGIFPNLRMGLQGLSATMKRRRALFRADITTYGYGAPTTEELVYWTYVYYNAGEFNGQLKKYKGKRKLGDWITLGEYGNSIKVLQSWQMVRDMKIF